ncbi:head GIN domain-containing protein [Parafilimonas sp.]|uniref:head GIN domain-containing protein n=1 Tax=Parafilimonas sp. TaxID=1969739 RepID=UPI0039E5231C
MNLLKAFISTLLLFAAGTVIAQTKKVDHFSKVIVSPYIQVSLVQGDEESVKIDDIQVDAGKLHIEVNNNTLRIYLEGAKDLPKNEKGYKDGYTETYSLYPKTSVTATITYKMLEALSVRGEETVLCSGPVESNLFVLRMYGEPDVTFKELNAEELSSIMYGEGSLHIKSGAIKNQKYTCYGDGKVNSLAANGSTSRVIAYGEPDFKLHVSDRIKITAFGSAQVHYKGNPYIDKGLHFGDLVVDKMD